jgi:chromosome segregation ATPase
LSARILHIVAVLSCLAAGWEAWLAGEVRRFGDEAAGVQQRIAVEVARVREAVVDTNDVRHLELARLRQDVNTTTLEVRSEADVAKSNAQSYAAGLTRRLATQRQRQIEAVRGELTTIRHVAEAVDAEAEKLDDEVRAAQLENADARSDIAQAASKVEQAAETAADVASRLPEEARAATVLGTSRDRRYLGFELLKSDRPRPLLPRVAIRLRAADPRRHTFTIELIAGGVHIEEKSGTLNEPLRFFVAESTQPYELVVSEVRPDAVRGYLAIPGQS